MFKAEKESHPAFGHLLLGRRVIFYASFNVSPFSKTWRRWPKAG
jgi:hypothetical protein